MGNLPSRTEAIAVEKLKQEQGKTKQIEAIAKQEQEKAKQEQEKAKQFAEETKAKHSEAAERIKQSTIGTTKAEGLAIQEVNKAKQIDVVTKNIRRVGWFGAGVVFLFGLDYLWNGNEWVIRQRIKHKLYRGHFKLYPSPIVTFTPSNPKKLDITFIPTVLLGPTGCGKSTLLSNICLISVNDCINI